MTTDFKTLFSQNCSGCHGDNGRNGAVRPIHDPVYLAAIPKSELQKVIEEGRDGTSMPPWLHERGGPLEPAQVDALVNGIEQNWAKPGYTLPDPPSYLAGDYKGDPLEGHKLFNRNCFMCHGKGARVGLVTDPSFLTLASDQSFRTALIAGRSDLGMPDYRYLNHGGALTDRNVTDIASYLSSLRPAQSAGGAQ
jgi:cytochrome c oxidase cbb3-type subunit 3/ubiquinol-cytochrome c reductase cytochrome c subunit